MNQTVWEKGQYRLDKTSDTTYAVCINNYEINIWQEDGEFVSSELHMIDLPKYVRQAIKKIVGDVI